MITNGPVWLIGRQPDRGLAAAFPQVAALMDYLQVVWVVGPAERPADLVVKV